MSRDYSADPDALAWARAQVQHLIGKYRKFETQARDQGNDDRATRWRKFANLLEMELVGGKTCVITPFDERRPQIAAIREKSGEEPAA